MAGALTQAARNEADSYRRAVDILREINECFEDVWLAREICRRKIGENPNDREAVQDLLAVIGQSRGNVVAAANVAKLKHDWEREEQDRAAARSQEDMGAELRQVLVASLTDVLPGILERAARSVVSEAAAAKLAAAISGEVLEGIACALLEEGDGT